MAKDQSDGQRMSEESIDFLEQVKKGKPRKFAMICKGTGVVSLVVYKKGNVEKRRKEAKESGRGQFYFGVVDGKGLDLRFLLARADGFETAPVKNVALKTYLEEAGDITAKPTFEIVDTAPLVLDEDDPLVSRYLQLKARSEQAAQAFPDRGVELAGLCSTCLGLIEQDIPDQASQTLDQLQSLLNSLNIDSPPSDSAPSPPPAPAPPPPPPNDNAEAERFIARLKQLKPSIDQAVSAGESQAEAIKTAAGQAAGFARERNFIEAHAALDRVESLLKQVTPPSGSSGDAALAFASRLKSLLPAITKAKGEGTPEGQSVALAAGEAATYARQKDFDAAHACLDRIDALLNPSSRSDSSSEPNLSSQFTTRLKALKPRLEQLIASGSSLGAQAKLLAGEAATLARRQDFGAALQVLDRIEPLIAAAEGSPSSESQNAGSESETDSSNGKGSKVALQQSVLMWEQACKRIDAELTAFEDEAMDLFRNDPRLSTILQNAYKLDTVLGEYAYDLRDRLDDAYNAPDDERGPLVKEALELLKTYRQYLSTDRFIKRLAKNKLRPIDIEGVLGNALDTVAMRLQA